MMGATQPPMTLGEEMALYRSDRQAWLAYFAPRMAKRLAGLPDDEAIRRWSGMSRDYQRALWLAMDDAQRVRVRRLRDAGSRV